jgi:2-methylcitrate dehydratase PrpD
MGPTQLTTERMSAADINDFMGRVSVVQDDDLNALYPNKTASRVQMTLKDGRTIERQVDVPRGDPSSPLETGDVADKMRRFAGSRDSENTDTLIEMILALEELEDLRELTELV